MCQNENEASNLIAVGPDDRGFLLMNMVAESEEVVVRTERSANASNVQSH